MREKQTNATIIYSVYELFMVALGKLPKDGNVMSKHVGATIHN
jgi:hypothetical protein